MLYFLNYKVLFYNIYFKLCFLTLQNAIQPRGFQCWPIYKSIKLPGLLISLEGEGRIVRKSFLKENLTASNRPQWLANTSWDPEVKTCFIGFSVNDQDPRSVTPKLEWQKLTQDWRKVCSFQLICFKIVLL